MAACFCNRRVFYFYGYKTINGGVGMSVATQVNTIVLSTEENVTNTVIGIVEEMSVR